MYPNFGTYLHETTPAQHLEIMRGWNHDFRLGFGDHEFTEAERKIKVILQSISPEFCRGAYLTKLVIWPCSGDARSDFLFLADRIAEWYGNAWEVEADIMQGLDSLQLRPGAPEPGPGIVVQLIDFGANWNRRAHLLSWGLRMLEEAHGDLLIGHYLTEIGDEVPVPNRLPSECLASAGILAAIASDDTWARTWEGWKHAFIPKMWLGGYCMRRPNEEPSDNLHGMPAVAKPRDQLLSLELWCGDGYEEGASIPTIVAGDGAATSP